MRSPNYLLVLEDSPSRLIAIQGAAKRLCLEVMHWSDVHAMRKAAPDFFENTKAISLDYDLSGSPYCELGDPGTGQDIVDFLLTLTPFCPVILHTSLAEKGKMLAASLRAAGWKSEWIGLKEQKDVDVWIKLIRVWAGEVP